MATMYNVKINKVEEEYNKLSDDSFQKELSRNFNLQTRVNVADLTDDAEGIILDSPEVVKQKGKTYQFVFNVNDVNLIEHIKDGMEYETAAYSIMDYWHGW